MIGKNQNTGACNLSCFFIYGWKYVSGQLYCPAICNHVANLFHTLPLFATS